MSGRKSVFAPLTLDFTFKKNFADEHHKERLIFLLNTFLAEKLQSPITDVIILNGEQLAATRFKRDAVIDVHCKDASGARFIVEVQVKGQEHFIKRTFFYLCMVISSLAKKGKKYDFNIPKLCSINILGFDLDFGWNCTESVQYLSVRNDNHPDVSYGMLQMVFVLLPRFKKTDTECETTMDKFIFALKNGHNLSAVPKNFKEIELQDIFEVARISNFSDMEWSKYDAAKLQEWDYNATMDFARKEARREGRAEGRAKGKAEGEARILALMEKVGYNTADIKALLHSD